MLIFDIETDGFLDELTMMSVAFTYDTDKEEFKEYLEEDTQQLVEDLNKADAIIAHNGIGFDKPALEKLTGGHITTPMYDTLVAARLYYPDIKGGHSLEAWGIRLKILKGEIKDDDTDIKETYGVYSKELSEYCQQDVEVTNALYNFLEKKEFSADLLLEELI